MGAIPGVVAERALNNAPCFGDGVLCDVIFCLAMGATQLHCSRVPWWGLLAQQRYDDANDHVFLLSVGPYIVMRVSLPVLGSPARPKGGGSVAELGLSS